ncbi:MAG: hypothetical protein KAH17_04535 [Bacteroidales bacterium]|nr:hypothetical protein [Bacteroidales bacterium]
MVRILIRRFIEFQSSIYSRAVMVIGVLSIFLLVSYQIIFRTVNDVHIKTVIYQNGNNIGSIVEGALYHSMLENNKKELQNTLDNINTLAGIDDVSMYDSDDNLAYSSFSYDTSGHINPNCKECHSDLKAMFLETEKSYRIIKVDDDCRMNLPNSNSRHLMIRSPILNQPSCYQNAACHAHSSDDKVLGYLVIKLPLADLDAAVAKASREFSMLAIFITLFIAFILIVFTRKKIKQPLQEIIEASKSIATGKSSVRLDVKSDQLDVVRTVSIAFNHMMDNLEIATTELQNWSKQLEYKVRKKSEELGGIQNELISIERKASLGKLSSSVAHELNNPLSGILVYTKLVTKKLRNMDIEPEKINPIIKHLSLIENETKRCGDIVRGLLDFSRKDQENFEPRCLHDILDDTFQLMHHPMMLANINFTKDFQAKTNHVSCSPNQLKQVFVAILVNASEAATEDGDIQIKTVNHDDSSITVEIIDNGIGMAPEDIPHIFEPFFTTKHQGDGIGLGLAIVHGLVLSHKGNINVTSSPGMGTTLSISLPLITNQEN